MAVSASWHGGVAIVAPSAHGGAIGGAGHGAAVLAGPAGSVVTHGNGAWGGHGGWGGWGGAWGGAWNGGWGGAGAWAGSGHEGQYVPDGTEHLYDDGSYRPEHHFAGHGLHGGHGHW